MSRYQNILLNKTDTIKKALELIELDTIRIAIIIDKDHTF